jgi:hypothetical protein
MNKTILLILLVISLLSACNETEPTIYRNFSGDVYVSMKNPNWDLWKDTGWTVQKDAEPREVESLVGNCNIFPLKEVSGQFIGRCVEKLVTVPVNGAEQLHVIVQSYKETSKHTFKLEIQDYQLAP